MQKSRYTKYLKYVAIAATVVTTMSVTWAAFSDKGKVVGGVFSVGNSDIKLLQDLRNGVESSNLLDEIAGPNFSDITPNWTQDYYFKVYNNGSTQLHLTSNANYETINDPDDLRTYIYAEFIEWNDNGDGQFEDQEEGENLGKKTITKWKTEGFDLGGINKGIIKGYVIRFSTGALSDTKQGKTGKFDFEIDAIQM